MLSDVCGDELNIIINYLPFKEIWKFRLLNKKYQDFMDHDFVLKYYICSNLNTYVINKHCQFFEKFIFSGFYDIDVLGDSLKNMPNLRTLILPHIRNMTDERLKYLSNIHTLCLPYCSKITNEGLKYIPNVRILYIPSNENITDIGLKYIPNVEKLNLFWNKNITDEGLKHISNIIVLILGKNKKISDEGLKYIQKVEHLDLCCNKNISGNGLKYIHNIKKLCIGHNHHTPRIKHIPTNILKIKSFIYGGQKIM